MKSLTITFVMAIAMNATTALAVGTGQIGSSKLPSTETAPNGYYCQIGITVQLKPQMESMWKNAYVENRGFSTSVLEEGNTKFKAFKKTWSEAETVCEQKVSGFLVNTLDCIAFAKDPQGKMIEATPENSCFPN